MGRIAKMAKKIATHCFKNMNLKRTSEPVDAYHYEGVTERLIKKMGKNNKGPYLKACK